MLNTFNNAIFYLCMWNLLPVMKDYAIFWNGLSLSIHADDRIIRQHVVRTVSLPLSLIVPHPPCPLSQLSYFLAFPHYVCLFDIRLSKSSFGPPCLPLLCCYYINSPFLMGSDCHTVPLLLAVLLNQVSRSDGAKQQLVPP